MKISGIVKSSFIDFPGAASTVIFLGGCNFNCGYCHNPEIVLNREGEIALPDFFAFLEKRRRFVDAVCISGGEPTIHQELYELTGQIKAMGFRVKLDTNGTNPDMLRRLLAEGLVDYVAMDIKGPWEKYGQIVRLSAEAGERMASAVRESLGVLLDVPEAAAYELRTTVCRELLSEADICRMAVQLSGAKLWYLQAFQDRERLLDEGGGYSAYTASEMEGMRQAAERVNAVEQVRLR